MDQSKVQKILEINRKTDVTQDDKNKLINEIMNGTSKEIKKDIELDIECNHYISNARIQCPSCDKYYGCRICHDENEDHKLDRYKVGNMECTSCNTFQEISNRCKGCDETIAIYYCDICHLFESNPDKQIHHCSKCKICRSGDKYSIKHCDLCDMCWGIEFIKTHTCVPKNRFKDDCTICKEELKNSRNTCCVMKCKHIAHSICIQEHLKNNNYQCPICRKSILDMSLQWELIEKYVNECIMPEEDRDKNVLILCNDCEQKSTTSYHYFYNKCDECGSWNTDILTIATGSVNQ